MEAVWAKLLEGAVISKSLSLVIALLLAYVIVKLVGQKLSHPCSERVQQYQELSLVDIRNTLKNIQKDIKTLTDDNVTLKQDDELMSKQLNKIIKLIKKEQDDE